MPVLRSSSRPQPTAHGAGSPTRRSQLSLKDINSSSPASSPCRAKNKETSRRPTSKPLQSGEIIEISSDEESGIQQSAIIADLHRQIARLKDENARHKRDLDKYKIQSLSKGKSSLDIAKIEDNLHCEICTLRLWSPYVLPECGHIFCQSCLHDWFTTILNKFVADNPGYVPNPLPQAASNSHPRSFATVNAPRPQYSCPTCRMAVSMKPAEVYALKAIVRAVASVAGEKSPNKNTSRRRSTGKQRNTPEGVWDRLFPM